MKEKILEMTNEELRKSCYLQRKICEMEEKHLFKELLLSRNSHFNLLNNKKNFILPFFLFTFAVLIMSNYVSENQ